MAFSDRQAVGKRGWRDATERLKAGVLQGDEDGTMVALGEALMWLDALNEWHAKTASGWKAAVRESIVEGAIYARNRVAHDLAVLLAKRDRYSDHYASYAAGYGVLTWRYFDEIDRPLPGHINEAQQIAYDKHLASRPVLDTVTRIDEFLTRNAP